MHTMPFALKAVAVAVAVAAAVAVAVIDLKQTKPVTSIVSLGVGPIRYLMRLEPYTSLHIYLQDGKFDRPDRMFDSIGAVSE